MLPATLSRFACIASAAFLCAPAMAVAAGTAAGQPARQEPLDLSIPRDVMLNPSTADRDVRQNAGATQQAEDRTGAERPQPGRSGWDDINDAPYGTGYEARQRRFGGGGGGGFGGGGGHGGGRGGGRGR